jgi:hypothetical protein
MGLAQQLFADVLEQVGVDVDGRQVQQRRAEVVLAISAMRLADTVLDSTSRLTKDWLLRVARSWKSRAWSSLSSWSATSLRARPPRATTGTADGSGAATREVLA